MSVAASATPLISADRILLGTPENPFSDPVARLDSPIPPPDVASIHATVRDELDRAIDSVRKHRRPAMLLVKGDPGQGKTHQLVWLRERADDGAYFFVEIPPLKDAEAPFGHILRYMVQGLHAHRAVSTSGATATSLERLLWDCLRRVAVGVRANAAAEDDDATVIRLDQSLLGDERFVDAFRVLVQDDPALGVLLHARGRGQPPLNKLMPDLGRVLCRLTERDARGAIFEWLRGAELPEDDLAILGVRRGVDSEERRFDVLHALVSLCTRPIALCFDQLESTSGLLGVDGSVALFTALMEMYQQTPVCIVLMCQTQHWGDLRDRVIPAAARDRVRELPALALPTPDEALRVVERRLELLWKRTEVQPPYPSYPFAPAFVRGFVAKIRPTIRRVLSECGERLDAMRRSGTITELKELVVAAAPTAAPPPHTDDLRVALGRGRDKQLRRVAEGDLREPSNRQEFLRAGIVHVLAACALRRRAVGGVTIVDVVDPPSPKSGARPPARITLATPSGAQKVVLALDVHSGESRGALGCLTRLQAVVDEGTAGVGVLVREAEVPISKQAKKTLEVVKTLADRGGGVGYLERQAVHRLVGAELLLDAVSAAEIWVGDRQATRDEALDFLVEHDQTGELVGEILSRALAAVPAPQTVDPAATTASPTPTSPQTVDPAATAASPASTAPQPVDPAATTASPTPTSPQTVDPAAATPTSPKSPEAPEPPAIDANPPAV